MKYLVANIGNSNLSQTIGGKSFDLGNYCKTNNLNFREYTQEQYNNLVSGKTNENEFSINIISNLLGKAVEPGDIIILVGSNQENTEPAAMGQDTIFSARIIAKLLENEGYTVEVKEYNNNVTKSDPLYGFFRELYQEIIQRPKFDEIILLEAGGTTHQKTAMTLLAEYMFEPTQYRLCYVDRNDAFSFRDQDITEFRGIISKFQAEQLVNNFQYDAARIVLGNTENAAVELIGLGGLLKNPVSPDEASKKWSEITEQNLLSLGNLESYCATIYKMFPTEENGAVDDTGKFFYIRIVFGIEKARFLLKTETAASQMEGLLAIYQVAEQLLDVIGSKLSNIPLYKSNKQKDKWCKQLNDSEKEKATKDYILEKLTGNPNNSVTEVRYTSKSMFHYAEYKSSQNLVENEIAETMRKVIKVVENIFHMSNHRNKFAHEGKLSTPDEINKDLAKVKVGYTLQKLLDDFLIALYPNEVPSSLFEDLNKEIMLSLRGGQ